MDGRFISYLRVSTQKQGNSGLGIEAQQQAILQFLNGGNHELVKEYIEIESGKRSDNRPVLLEALAHCKRIGATLLIAKLDRLSRNVAFIASLMDSGAEFIAVDMPTANRLTVHILAAMAEHERSLISKRTKDALQAAKARGVKLGNPQGLPEGAQAKAVEAGTKSRVQKADSYSQAMWPIIQELLEKGMSYNSIAKEMMSRRELTPRGKVSWTPTTVSNIVKRMTKGKV